MADSSGDADDGNCGENWELLPAGEPQQEAVTLVTGAAEALRMDYFAFLTLSSCQAVDQAEAMPLAAEVMSRDGFSAFILPMESAGTICQELAYANPLQKAESIEPSPPYDSIWLSNGDKDGASTEAGSFVPGSEIKAEAPEGRQVDSSDIATSSCPSDSGCNPGTPSLSNRSDIASEKWWKRTLWVLQGEAAQGNSLCSIAMAAAIAGLLLLGHRLHRIQIQNKRLCAELEAKEKKISQLMYQLSRAKEHVSCIKQVPIIGLSLRCSNTSKWQ